MTSPRPLEEFALDATCCCCGECLTMPLPERDDGLAFDSRLWACEDCIYTQAQEILDEMSELEKKFSAQVEATIVACDQRDEALRLLGWFIGQCVGDSGTGESFWEEFPEFRAAQRALADPVNGEGWVRPSGKLEQGGFLLV